MSRHRWFDADWSMSVSAVAKSLKSLSFRDEASDGFVLEHVRPDHIIGSFYERFQEIERVVDPFGRDLSFEWTEFRRSAFRMSQGQGGLQLIDPSRSSQRLLNRLHEVTDYKLKLRPIQIDVHTWARAVQAKIATSTYLDLMQIGGIELSATSEAAVVVRGKQDVADAAFAFIEGTRSSAVEKVRIKSVGLSGAITLSQSAGAHLTVPDESEVLGKIREALDEARLPTVGDVD